MPVLSMVLRRRLMSTVWWGLGLVGFVLLLAVAYPAVRGNAALDKTFAGLPPGVESALGLSSQETITSPAGYLNSQYFANILPILLLVFSLGLAAWSIAGDEAAGTLELLLSRPVSRVRVGLERFGALFVLLAALTGVAGLALVVLAPLFSLSQGLSGGGIMAATVATALLALTFGAVAFFIGAGTGNRGLAVAVSSTLAVAGFVIEGLGAQVQALHGIREASPWHWLLSSDALHAGLTWQAWALPLATTVVLVGLGVAVFARRDLR